MEEAEPGSQRSAARHEQRLPSVPLTSVLCSVHLCPSSIGVYLWTKTPDLCSSAAKTYFTSSIFFVDEKSPTTSRYRYTPEATPVPGFSVRSQTAV